MSMTKGIIEFDLSTPQGRDAMSWSLNAPKLRSALIGIREVLFKKHNSVESLKDDISDEIQFLTHLLDE